MFKLPIFTSKAFLAPMAGVSDPALRLICKELGAGLVVTEFTNIHAIVAMNKKLPKITQFIEYSDAERPLSCQLFGSEIDILAKAVKIVEPYFDIIDYNMGCPAPHITCQMAGAALLQDPELTRKIFRTMVQSTTKPVTLKLRAGLSQPDKFKIIAKIAEEEGIAMITLHARTLKQGYSGKADWNLIRELKQLVKIPIVGNGDINTPEDAKRMLDETGCDYVMIGRAACRNPFIFTQINEYLATGSYSEITYEQRLNYFFRYLDYARKYPTIRFANIRLQAMNFTKGKEGSKDLRVKIGKVRTINELKEVLVQGIQGVEI
ncbi:MAG TPA: tRNA dihydrouridine synthase DusB [Candidatus Nanoarchaeia archaeon]|nr:tRNA dihydrouridine synthase DusB [Candidatus Nanoarchaeia archaeon]